MILLDRLQAAGFSLKVSNGKLLVSPASKLTEAQRKQIAQHRDALVAALAEDDVAILDSTRFGLSAEEWRRLDEQGKAIERWNERVKEMNREAAQKRKPRPFSVGGG